MFCLDIISADIYVRKSTSISARENRSPSCAGNKGARFISLNCLQELKSKCPCILDVSETAKLCTEPLLPTAAPLPCRDL